MKFIIQDWAGNVCFHGKEFDSFEDAWGFIYERPELTEEDYQEYYVTTERTRAARYLDPNDPRPKLKGGAA